MFELKKCDERSWQHFRAAAVLGDAFATGRVLNAAVCCGHIAVVTASSTALASGSVERAPALQRVLVSVHGAAKIVWIGFLDSVPLRLCCADAAGTLFAWEFAPDDSAWIAIGSNPGFFSPPPTSATVFDASRSTFVWADSAATASAIFTRSVTFEAKPNPKLPGRRNMLHSVTPGPLPRRTELEVAPGGGGWRVSSSVALPDVGLWLHNNESSAVRLFSFKTQTLAMVMFGSDFARLHSAAVHPLTGELVVLDTNGALFVVTANVENSVSVSRLSNIEVTQPGDIPLVASASFAIVRHFACIATPSKCRFFDLLSGVRVGETDLPATAPPSQKPRFLGPAQSDAASLCCIWWSGFSAPLYQFVWPSPTAYAELLINAAVKAGQCGSDVAAAPIDDEDEAALNSPDTRRRDAAALAAVSICADWGLDQWVAQSAFDLLLKGVPHRNVEQVARALSSRLQNPALVVSLLAARNMSGFIEDEISRFLSDFTASSAAASDNRDTRRAAALTAYQSFTPLNTKVFPDLLKFLQLIRSQEQGALSAAAAATAATATSTSSPSGSQTRPLTPAEIPVSAVLGLDWQTLWRLAEEHPQPLCDKLLAALNLRVADIERISPADPVPARHLHPALLQEEPHAPGSSTPAREVGAKAAARQPQAMFELCCNTLFACNPRVLPPFVAMVSNAEQQRQQQQQQQQQSPQQVMPEAIRKRGFAERALLAIPLAVLEGSSPAHQTTAAAMLLAMSGRPLPAMLLLLRAGLWDESLQLLAEAETSSKPELFAVALHSCLQTHKVDRLERLWKLAPPQLTALDVVQAISMHTAQNEAPTDVTVVDPSRQFPLGAFKRALLDFVRRS